MKKNDKEVKVLNRIITVDDYGYTYEADAWHSELIVKNLNLQNAKLVYSAGSEAPQEGEKVLLEHGRFKLFQSVCARANFLAIDRSDVQHTTKECCRAMSKPTERYWSRLKRLGRYLLGKPRLQYQYKFQNDVHKLTTYADSNWASNSKDRKSTSGRVILH